MACRDYTDEESHAMAIKEMQARLDLATRVACTALSFIDRRGKKLEFIDKEALKWWEDHKEKDKKRKAREAKDNFSKAIKSASARLQLAIDTEHKEGIKAARRDLDELLKEGGLV